jgi:drug/metabolite transporter (DMT)-like permease
MDKKLAPLLIGIGASFWGIIGMFVTYLYEMGFTPTQVVAIRSIAAAIFLLAYVLVKDFRLLKIKVADSKYFVGTGVFSIVLFNWCMFSAIEETSISISAILLYTAPAFVAILSKIIFKEVLTWQKLLALFVTFAGCILVIGLFPNHHESITFYGLLLGIGSGFFYALYSIFGKFALRKYDSLTVTVYTFIFAAIAITPLSKVWTVLPLFFTIKVWIYIIGLGFFSTMLPYLLYTRGIKNVELSRASIIATVEPVVASIVGFFIFHEQLTIWQYIGIGFVLAAVFLVQDFKISAFQSPKFTQNKSSMK